MLNPRPEKGTAREREGGTGKILAWGNKGEREKKSEAARLRSKKDVPN
jgi:hypothetical protein